MCLNFLIIRYINHIAFNAKNRKDSFIYQLFLSSQRRFTQQRTQRFFNDNKLRTFIKRFI